MKEKIEQAVNTMKLLGVDMISMAGSGHPGIVLGAAPIIYSLYANVLNFNPSDPQWINRDRFIMSAGHGSALLYATLHMAGYNITLDDLTKFRQIGSIVPGHPELNITPGVEVTTGPLGQGFANAVGIAFAERYLSNVLQEQVPKQKVIDYYTYALVSDGDLMEGISYEAAAFAGKQNLHKLIVLYDSNDISSDGRLEFTTKEDTLKRFHAAGWNTDFVHDGTSVGGITKAINKAKRSSKPTIIEIKTILGRGSLNQNQNIIHNNPLTKDDLNNLRKTMNVTTDFMEVNQESIEFFQDTIKSRINKYYKNWQEYFQKFNNTNDPEIRKILNFLINQDISLDFNSDNFKIQDLYKEEIRDSNSKILNVLSSKTKFFIGGSSDLAGSTKTNINNTIESSPTVPLGKNIYFGIREQAMGGILNGMALSGLRVYGSTFLVFSDYLKPQLRLSAMMNLPVTYIFTHDSVDIGEDGPTHQSVEHLTSLRATPNIDVYRPCDINEVIGSWEAIIKRKKTSALVISKQAVEIIKNTNGKSVFAGAYIIKEAQSELKGIIIATGSEVSKVLEATKERLDLRIVSMPSQELFLEQQLEYQEKILPKNILKISVEAGSTMSFKGISNYQIGIDTYGVSGKTKDILEKYKLDPISIKNKIDELIK